MRCGGQSIAHIVLPTLALGCIPLSSARILLQGMEELLLMQELVKLSGTDMRLMVASVRDPSEIAHLSAHVRLHTA